VTVDLRSVVGAGARLDASALAFFRYRRIGDRVLLTNYEGNWLLVSDDEFARVARGDVSPGTPLHDRLREGNFLRAEYDVPKAAARVRERKSFLNHGPKLHVLTVTLRCNEACSCDGAACVGMDAVDTDMSIETAERAVDFILRSTSASVVIEFQGGEPLLNFDVVKHAIEYATQRNESVAKQLAFVMVSNFSLMDEEKLGFLAKHKVLLSTRVEGPEQHHDRQRRLSGLSSYQSAKKWIGRVNEQYRANELDPALYRVEAQLTVTRETLPLWKEVVDAYVELGVQSIFLRPGADLGRAGGAQGGDGYSVEEYLDFYRQATDYVLALSAKGTPIVERYAGLFLTKILAGEDPNFLDIRSPGGAGIGQLAYDHEGKIFTCDEGRLLHRAGDDAFLLGDVRTTSYRAVTGHATVRTLAIASQRDSQPDCVDCAYNPYCGVSPVHSHKTLASLWGPMRSSSLCAVHKGVQDYLFGKLARSDSDMLEVLQRWTMGRGRENFLRSGTTSA
jgi:His-Xaa-Ser system radical SAM maturase HxsB